MEEKKDKGMPIGIIGHVDIGKTTLLAATASLLAIKHKGIPVQAVSTREGEKLNPEVIEELRGDLSDLLIQEAEKDAKEAEAVIELTNPRKDLPDLYSPPPTRAERRAADRKKNKKKLKK